MPFHTRLSAAMVACALLAGLILSCQDNPFAPTEPGGPGPRPAAVAAPRLEGCTRFVVHLRGLDSVSVESIDAGCGAVRPVLASAAVFDRVHQRVLLPVAIHNGSLKKGRAPAAVYGWRDSMSVVAPPGLAGNAHIGEYLDFTNADSVVAAIPFFSAHVWDFSAALAATNPQILPAGSDSRPDTIAISVKQGVEALTLELRATVAPARSPVPATPPDTVPEGFWADTVSGYGCVSNMVIRNTLILGFKEGTPQEQRQEAVDAIDGEVVGGDTAADWYYVRLPDEGSARVICRAMEMLRALPQVEIAVPVQMSDYSGSYRKPYDGPEFRTWSVRPGLADGSTWALDYIKAPLAWGCAVGTRSTPIAVIDGDFTPVAEVLANVDRREQVYPMPDAHHGAAVASVIGANGNDSIGMTGVMWRSSLRLYDPMAIPGSSRKTPPIATSIYNAAAAGAKVVNISLARSWPRRPLLVRDSARADSASVIADTAILGRRIRRAAASGHRPLLVIGAGNDTSVDAYWGVLPLLVKSFPSRVLVVTGISRMGTQEYRAGPLVSIAAPSDGVWAEKSDNVIGPWRGTSFATPLVSGIAGLLLSFDPRLTAADLRDLILRGAQNGGRTVRSPDGTLIPVADAYESLKLAGRRPGARLCGTRLWTDGGALLAERDGGPETLFNIGGPSRYTDALHGGERIQFFDDARWDRREIAYQPGGLWREVPVAPVDRPSLGATYLSQSRVSHNADSVVSAENDGIYIGLNALDRKWRRLQSQPPLPSGGSKPDSVCWGGNDAGTCVLGWTAVGSSSHSVPYAAYSPMGDSIYAAVTTYSSSTKVSGLTEHCRLGSGVDSSGILNHTICPRFTTTSGPDETRVYAVPILSADPPRLVYTVPGAEVTWIGVGEGASEFVLHLRSVVWRGEGQGTCAFLADGYTNYCGQGMTYTTTTQDCRYEWVSARGVLLSNHTTKNVCLGLGEVTIADERNAMLQGGPRRRPAPSPFLLRPQLNPGFH